MIEIDGTNTGALTVDAILHFMPTADGSAVRGLVLNRAASSGILVEGTDGLVIDGNFIGTNPAGTAGLGNAFAGILLNTGPANVTIGGTTPAARNLISGNTFYGISFGQGGGAGGGGTNHLVQGNLIGTDASGGNAIPGQQTGIETLGTTSNILIGGTTAASRNVASGNVNYGIRLRGTGAGKVVSGNYVGTNPAGDAPVPNENHGIEVEGTDVLVGGTAEGAGNLASGNGLTGINIFQAVGAVVQGNLVGTDATGTFAIGNGTDGIVVGANGTIVGGINPGEGNTIAYNLGSGIEVQGLTAALNGNPIRGNSIYSNGGIGIDLGGDGVTANDDLDADGGPNSRQNYPIVISAAPSAPSGTHVEGTLDSAASTNYTLDFYASPACEGRPQDFTEGPPVPRLDGRRHRRDGPRGLHRRSRLHDRGRPARHRDGDRSEREYVGAVSPHRVLHLAGLRSSRGRIALHDLRDRLRRRRHRHGRRPARNGRLRDLPDPDLGEDAGPPARFSRRRHRDQPRRNRPGRCRRATSRTSPTFPSTISSTRSSRRSSATGSRPESAAATTAWTFRRCGSRWRSSCSRPSSASATCLRRARASSRDVACTPGSGFGDWIEALAAEGITGGCGGGNYCPTSPVTRQQMAVFLLKTEHGSTYVPPACDGDFADVPCPSTFADWIEQLAAEDITGGCGGGNYCPLNPNTRGQMAVFLTKTFNLQ